MDGYGTLKKILKYIPDLPGINELIVYLSSVIYHKSLTFYFGNTLNAFLLRSKTRSHALSGYVDKVACKAHIAATAGSAHVIQTLGFWDERRILPLVDRWVFKSNDDFSGALIFDRGVLIDVKKVCFSGPISCESTRDIVQALETFVSTKGESPFHLTREACYLGIRQRFFFEEVVSASADAVIPVDEYKFHIVNGRIACVYLVLDRLGSNKRVIVDESGTRTHVVWCKLRDRHKFEGIEVVKVSDSFDVMKEVALKTSKGFRYVRVDVYVCSPPRVGELTFFHGSGLERILPVEFDKKLGYMVNENVT